MLRQSVRLDTNDRTRDTILPAMARCRLLPPGVLLPICPQLRIVGVALEGIKRFESSMAPTVFPFVCIPTPTTSPPDGRLDARASAHLPSQPMAQPETASQPQPKPKASPPAKGSKALSPDARDAASGAISALTPLSAVPGAPAVVDGVTAGDGRVVFKAGFKREDMRKDWIIQGMIGFMRRCLAQDNIDAPILQYRVLPTSAVDGLVEWVTDAMTLTDIETSYHQTIQNFLQNNNPEKPIRLVRETFMRSLAASTVITFLMVCESDFLSFLIFKMVGDRHKENMMVHRSGVFFHIDYGFVSIFIFSVVMSVPQSFPFTHAPCFVLPWWWGIAPCSPCIMFLVRPFCSCVLPDERKSLVLRHVGNFLTSCICCVQSRICNFQACLHQAQSCAPHLPSLV